MKKFNINEIYKIAGKGEGGKGVGGDKDGGKGGANGENKDEVKEVEEAKVEEKDNGVEDKTGEDASKPTVE